MTSPTPTPAGTPSGGRLASRRVRVALIAMAVIALLLLALVLWYFFLRPAGPPPIGPGAPVIPTSSLAASLV